MWGVLEAKCAPHQGGTGDEFCPLHRVILALSWGLQEAT